MREERGVWVCFLTPSMEHPNPKVRIGPTWSCESGGGARCPHRTMHSFSSSFFLIVPLRIDYVGHNEGDQ
jgi:hypothetical protein